MNATLAVASGSGRLARRADGLLFVASLSDPPRWAPIIDGYLDAERAADAREVVTSAAVAAGFALDPFVMIAWGAEVELLVLGAIDVRTDLPSVPVLSGATSATWVEHRVVRPPATARLAAGVRPDAGTRLDAGVVGATGFLLALAAGVGTSRPSITDLPAHEPAPPVRAPAAVPAGVPAVTPTTPSAPDRAAGPRDDALAILDAATGGDWMEESLDLGGDGWRAPQVAAIADPDADPEATLSPPPAAAPPSAVPPPSTGGAVVRARRCGHGHPNAPHAAQCRTCGELIGPSSVVETIPQPVLGRIVLPDGTSVAVAGTIVLGRRPDTATARVGPDAQTVAVDASADVSRTHVVVRADGWMMTVTDCASRGRTVVRSPGAPEPVVLEPWVPHELAGGDSVYLGGPTQLQIARDAS